MGMPDAPTENGGNKIAFLMAADGVSYQAVTFQSIEDLVETLTGADSPSGPLRVARQGETGTLLSSSARTATNSSSDATNHGWAGVMVIIDVTAGASTPSVVPSISAKDPVTGNYVSIAAFTAITSTTPTTYVYTLRPGVTVSTSQPEAKAASLPKTWRLTMTHADSDSLTYSASYTYLA